MKVIKKDKIMRAYDFINFFDISYNLFKIL